MPNRAAPPRPSPWPAIVLALLSPLITEVLPGATRLSAMFVFPVEVAVWGGGALLIRYAVRRWDLGWTGMLLLALALAVAEECVIQQTSLAPLVVNLAGRPYARAFGVNYVYLLWALVYESVFVVLLPVALTELIFPDRRRGVWLNRAGVAAAAVFFVLGSFMAWLSWTQYARPKAFHLPPYTPPTAAFAIAIAVIALLVLSAFWLARRSAPASSPLAPPPPWLIGALAAAWGVFWYGLVLLAFGVAPQIPPAAAVVTGLAVSATALLVLPRWASHPCWTVRSRYAVIFGVIAGTMLLSFVGFRVGSADFVFKAAVDALAALMLVILGLRLRGPDRRVAEMEPAPGQ